MREHSGHRGKQQSTPDEEEKRTTHTSRLEYKHQFTNAGYQKYVEAASSYPSSDRFSREKGCCLKILGILAFHG